MSTPVEPRLSSPLSAPKTSRQPAPDQTGLRWSDVSIGSILSLFVVAPTLVWAYWPNLVSLVTTWSREPDYTHGFLVLPIAGFILWKRWPQSVPDEGRSVFWGPGWVMVVAALVLRAYFHEKGQGWLESATMLLAIVGLGFSRLGWRKMVAVWPAFAFLVFLYPLPPQINSALSQPLQSFATVCSCALLKLTGLWVMPEGNVIMVGNERLEVAAACNGLSMLMSLAAVVSAVASLFPMTNWKRLILLPSIIPIALVSNVLRIVATAWCYYAFGAKVGSTYAHDAAGWLMMPMAMFLVWLELTFLSWFIIETEVAEKTIDRLGLGMTSGGLRPPGVRS